MRIGFVNVFSFRPHVEHLYYLSKVLSESGHAVFFLTCDASVSNCYARAIKGTGKVKECSKCILGGVRSYTSQNVTPITNQKSGLTESELERLTLSSSCTLLRTESDKEWDDPEVVSTRKSLHAPVGSVYESTKQWIKDNKLDAVICFNGRMDLTRAVTHACESLGLPFICHERTWFGDGIRLVPNGNCLGLKALGELVSEFDDRPLTEAQARFAGKLVGERFLQRNSLEWRLYNRNPEPAPWPTSSLRKRVLIVPSSKNEFAGHEDWETGWEDNTQALDDFLEINGILPEQVVVRCHPNWSENIGRVTGERSLNLYRNWAEQRGIYLVSSEEKASTYDLIQQSDIVVLNGGSSAVEAGACGKQVVCLGPAPYENAGFVQVFRSRAEMEKRVLVDIDTATIQRKTLRFLYVSSHRFPQFVDYVKAVETTKYEYFIGGSADRIIDILKTGRIQPDDPSYGADEQFENDVLVALNDANWAGLADYEIFEPRGVPYDVSRRRGLRWIDSARSKFKRGDR
ncbi:capsule biosynthesis protein [Marinobacter sediminicola]|uniref:capsule biosynthesis protein n=1 Tax=Marinobacter sediminicola TaxID=3072994 RepID=UPI0028110593|nr:capsule biosynthesis protein [Marinobacter sp. F26243]